MLLQLFRQVFSHLLTYVITAAEQYIKSCLQPTPPNLILGTFTELQRSKSELMIENAFLRQHLAVLRCQTKLPVLNSRDRGVLVLLASLLRK